MDPVPYGPAAVEQWRTDGWCLLEGLFAPEEVDAGVAEVQRYFPSAEQVAGGDAADFNLSWDTPKPVFPFRGDALNALALHDSLIDLAEDLLGTDQVRLYQGTASAKYTGSHHDYEQLLHADYGNHTLVVPRDDVGYQHLLLFVYLSDVTPDRAATRIVPRSLTGGIPVERTYLALDEYADLYAAEVPACGPAGTVLAYRPDVYHRGTALRAPASSRFLLHVAYKPVATDWAGYHTFPVHGESPEWHRFVRHATPRQLIALGFPEPGHPYWTTETLLGVSARYPALDMSPWFAATPGPGAG
jgi:hypothetical protein